MILVDARRLTGPNLLSRSPQVVVELTLEAGDPVLDTVRDTYLAELGRMRVALGLSAKTDGVVVRPHRGGAVIANAAPLDLLLPFTEMAEWALLSTCEIVAGRPPLALEPKRAEVATLLEEDRSVNLLAIASEARQRGLPFLWDDTEVSVGAGEHSVCWPKEALPDATEVAWDKLDRIPIALITGTNGKTTSTRLLAHVAREAGRRVGCSSSDAILIGNEKVVDGDWTGPAAARIVLRRTDVDFAVLETARGGILRRGLAMETCDAALITNVSEDHTGGYGIDDLEAMTRVKGVVADAVRAAGSVVLNAHDPKLVALASRLTDKSVNVVFFADLERHDDEAASDVIARHRASKKGVVYTEAGAIWSTVGGDDDDAVGKVVGVADVPITFGGAARYNVENALGVVGMSLSLGFSKAVIASGLRSFQPSDNPRRGEVIERDGVRVLLDFGHNPEGVRSVMKLVASLHTEGGKLTVVAGAAGDRTDDEVRRMCRTIVDSKVDHVYVRDLADYLRGRAPGEMPALFHRELTAFGMPSASIVTASSETEALRLAFDGAKPGDFVVVLVHLDHDEVHAFLNRT